MRLVLAERAHHDTPSTCWHLGWLTRAGKTWIAHISFGRPVWWRPSVGRKTNDGIDEWRAGWLLACVQIATRRTAALADPETETDRSGDER